VNHAVDITIETTEDGGRHDLISYVALSENAHLAETAEQIAKIGRESEFGAAVTRRTHKPKLSSQRRCAAASSADAALWFAMKLLRFTRTS